MRSDTEILRESVDWHTMADAISRDSGLFDNLEKFGEVIITGSYKYDLMMSGDIDIHLLCKPTKSLAASIANSFIDDGWWRSVKYVDNYRHIGSGRTNWPKSYYIGLSKWVDDHKWGVDIWLMHEAMNAQRLHPWIEEMLTDEKKIYILRLKDARRAGIISPGGFDIYDAVLRNGVTDVESFIAWRNSSQRQG